MHFHVIAVESTGVSQQGTGAFVVWLGHVTILISGERCKAAFSAYVCRLQQSVETPSPYYTA